MGRDRVPGRGGLVAPRPRHRRALDGGGGVRLARRAAAERGPARRARLGLDLRAEQVRRAASPARGRRPLRGRAETWRADRPRPRHGGAQADRYAHRHGRGEGGRDRGEVLEDALADRARRAVPRRAQRGGVRAPARPYSRRGRQACRGGRHMTALSGIRVIELASERIAFAGKLLADMGADVILVEPPGGDPARSYGPFADDQPGPERSLWWWHYHTSKRGVVLDLDQAADRARLKALVASADI